MISLQVIKYFREKYYYNYKNIFYKIKAKIQNVNDNNNRTTVELILLKLTE